MYFGSRGVLNAMAREMHAPVRTPEASAPRFDALLFGAVKAYLDLASRVVATSGGKMVQAKHLQLMQHLACTARSNKHAGGSTVLPSEYFGIASGAYSSSAPSSSVGGSARGRNVNGDHVGGSTVLPSEYFGIESGAYSGSTPSRSVGGSVGGGRNVKVRCKGKSKVNDKHVGGSAVLPSEYFGIASDSYHASVPAHTAYALDMARASLPASFSGGQGPSEAIRGRGANSAEFFAHDTLVGGGPPSPVRIPNEVFDALVREYRQRTGGKQSLRLSADAKAMLRTLVEATVSHAVSRSVASTSRKSLTPQSLDRASKNLILFPSAA